MSVKTIFKVLIGTVFWMIMASLCLELFNVNVAGMEIKSACTMAAKQSAELFTQETYKSDSGAKSVNISNIKTSDGTVYVSGNFYGTGDNSDAGTIWTNLYYNSTTLKKVCELTNNSSYTTSAINTGNSGTRFHVTYSLKYISSGVGGDSYILSSTKVPSSATCPASIFTELGELYAGLFDTTAVNNVINSGITYNDFKNGTNLLKQKSFAENANDMVGEYYTPVNIGFPYFDPTVVNKMFQWDLAMILSNNTSDSIVADENGKYYVNYKGFRCYVQDACINKLNYYIIDVNTDNSKLKYYTGMDKSGLELIGDENSYVTVVGIEYTIPIAYQGITPLKQMIEYAWNREVEGTTAGGISTDRTGMTGSGTYSYATQSMTNDASSSNGALSTTGTLYYVITR